MAQRFGIGYDSHAFGGAGPLVLGGVRIEYERGLTGHSDADALCHAITDALLGAAALGDIGRHFPDTDERWRGADSLELLARTREIVADAGYGVTNVDATILTEAPKLAPHVDSMRANLAKTLLVPVEAVSVKAKTNEGMDAVGRGEGLVVHAIAAVESV